MAGRYDRKQTRYDPARAGAYAAPASSASPSSDAASGVPAASPTPAASAAPSGAAAKSSDFWQGKVLAPYSGDELVYQCNPWRLADAQWRGCYRCCRERCPP